MIEYHDLLKYALTKGQKRQDRTGTGTLSLFSQTLRFDLQDGFPLVTTKRVSFKSVVAELLWFLEGSTDNNRLNELGATIWDEWADESGDLGPIYGKQWRDWNGVDQIHNALELLKHKPYSRRNVVSAWNVSDLPSEYQSPQDNVAFGKMALAPCHFAFQFYVSMTDESTGKPKLNCQVIMRSCDLFLGLPFNIASYALLTHLVANSVGMVVGELSILMIDAHIYLNHLDQVNELISRVPKTLPRLELPNDMGVNNPDMGVILSSLKDYHAYPAIKAPIAV